jgi:4-hydroxy 2-oxovalerate aldolase
MVKILDCTIRDGGYYNDWDFDNDIVDLYLSYIQKLPIDVIEIGYISRSIDEYAGKYFYLNKNIITEVRKKCKMKIAVMIDLKSISNHDEIDQLTNDLENIVDIIRLATNFSDIEKAKEVSVHLKQKGFDVCINLMKFSDIKIDDVFISKVSDIDKYTDILYIVDSYGSILPHKLKDLIRSIKKVSKVKTGFHGHNNLELALANTIIAIENGVDIVDATITGMGRGAGNLKLELLLVYLNSLDNHNTFMFNELSTIVERFNQLQNKYKWGTNLPYMISGAFSLPQKRVMDLIRLDRYSFDSIIKQIGIKENKKFPIYKPKFKAENTILIGGRQINP